MKQFLGTWQSNTGKDTVEIWETQQYGKAFLINAYRVIKGKKIPYYLENIGFDSNEGQFKGYIISQSGAYFTWIGLFTSEKKLSLDMVENFNPGTVYMKREHVFANPDEWTATVFNKDGVKTSEEKWTKVK
jgi:hypothetical protein